MSMALVRATLAARHRKVAGLKGLRKTTVPRDLIQKAWNPTGNTKVPSLRGTTWIPLDEIFSDIPPDASESSVISHLKSHRSMALRACLRVAFDDSIVVKLKTFPDKWAVNDAPLGYSDSCLSQEYKILKYFVSPEFDKLGEKKAYDILCRRLEALSLGEAQLLLTVIQKQVHVKYPAVTKSAVLAAFPDLIDPKKQKESIL